MDVRATTDDPPRHGRRHDRRRGLRGQGHPARRAGRRARRARRRPARRTPKLALAAHVARRRPALDPRRLRRARRVRRRARADRRRRRARPGARAGREGAVLGAAPQGRRRRRRARSSRARCSPPTATRRFKSEPGEDRAPAVARRLRPPRRRRGRRGRPRRRARPPTARATSATRRPTRSRRRRSPRARARSPGVQVEVHGPRGDRGGRHGRVRRVAQGAAQRAAADHDPPRAGRRGAARCSASSARRSRSTRGGYSIKPAARMHEMKFDMCGGAAVLEATAAIAELGLPVRLVVGDRRDREPGLRRAPCGRATSSARKAGITIEVNNTDAEGRLVLADCLTHARDQGAERLLDLATLTGGIVTTFGNVHAGLMGNDDAWCDAVTAAGEATGERVWRLPLDPLYDELIKGRYGDLINSSRGPQGPVDHRRRAAAPLRRRRARGRTWTSPGSPTGSGGPYAQQGRVGLGRAAAAAAGRQNGLMDFDLPPDHELIRRTVREFAEGEIAPVAEELDRTKAFPYAIVKPARRARADGDPVPRGGRRRRRRLARLRARGRGARAGRLVRRDHHVRAHVAGHAADLPVRQRRAAGRVAARADRRGASSARSG